MLPLEVSLELISRDASISRHKEKRTDAQIRSVKSEIDVDHYVPSKFNQNLQNGVSAVELIIYNVN